VCTQRFHAINRRDISLVRPSFNQTKKISVISWLLKNKTLKPDISARKASTYLDLRYPTTLNAFEQVLRSIVHHLANDDALLRLTLMNYIVGKDEKEKEAGEAGTKPWYPGSEKRGGILPVGIVRDGEAGSLITKP